MPKPKCSSANSFPASCLLSTINTYLQDGRLGLAISTLPLLARCGRRPSFTLLSSLLRLSLSHPSPRFRLPFARRIFFFLRLSGLYSSPFLPLSLPLANPLLSFLSQSLQHSLALRLFRRIPHPDHVSFNYVLVAAIQRSSHSVARQLHARLLHAGFLHPYLCFPTSLLMAYAKSGHLADARNLFDEMPHPDTCACTAMVHVYAISRHVAAAMAVFKEMPERSTISWNALLGGFVRNGQLVEAMDLLRQMVAENVPPDQFTYSNGLCVCAAAATVAHGKEIHGRIIRTEFHPNSIVVSTLVDMYSRCGDLRAGWRVFITSGRHDTVLCNTMMSAMGQHRLGKSGTGLFGEMLKRGAKPDANTFSILHNNSFEDENCEYLERMNAAVYTGI